MASERSIQHQQQQQQQQQLNKRLRQLIIRTYGLQTARRKTVV